MLNEDRLILASETNRLLYAIFLELKKMNSRIEHISQEKEVVDTITPLENEALKRATKRKSSK